MPIARAIERIPIKSMTINLLEYVAARDFMPHSIV